MAVIAACLGGGGICVGALFGIKQLNRSAGGIPDATKDLHAWWVASRIRDVQEILLAVSALLAVILVAGAILLLLGKSAGRPAVLIGSTWGFLGGLIAATYGGEHGLAAQSAASPFYLIIGAALCLVALVTIATSPPGRPTASPVRVPPLSGHEPPASLSGHQSPASLSGHEPPAWLSGHQPPASLSGHEPPASLSGHQSPAPQFGRQPLTPQFGQHPPAPQSRPPH
ncbi:hypothetical protein IU450_04435 [Nocardia abscessus]|uniref:hypothetical protein n=1 Tax=Nocardia abscessus TaxID=120957 RepID=UPI00189538B8|nr:hypothetical protein [Nocardia abscessus]MBF6335130.1 hypothetical protein [Nocardia abscessus]